MSSSVPSAVNAFISLIQAALPANTQVVLGSTFPIFAGANAVLVENVHFTEDAYAELGPTYRHEEHYNLVCCLYCQGGRIQDEPDIAALMTATYALYNTIQITVANNPTLGLNTGTTGFRIGWPRQLGFVPTWDINGLAYGKLDFEVECEARVNSLS